MAAAAASSKKRHIDESEDGEVAPDVKVCVEMAERGRVAIAVF